MCNKTSGAGGREGSVPSLGSREGGEGEKKGILGRGNGLCKGSEEGDTVFSREEVSVTLQVSAGEQEGERKVISG